MPHDIHGEELKIGDHVTIRCVVKSVNAVPDFCNLTLETVEKMFPGEYKTSIIVNTKQVEKVRSEH